MLSINTLNREGQDSSSLTYATTFASLILALSCYHYYVNYYTYFRRRGVDGPVPFPLVGNLFSLMVSTNRLKTQREWLEKYGKFYGIFRGTKPTFIVSDAEVMRQICIKDFAAMPNHGVIFPMLDGYLKDFLIATNDNHWRRLRAIQTPLFTSGKMRRMFKLLDRCAEDLALNFNEELDRGKQQLSKPIANLKDIYSLYTLDAITTAAYSIKLDRKPHAGDESTRGNFATIIRRAIDFSFLRIFTTQIVPVRLLRAIGFEMVPAHYYHDLADRLRPFIDQRRNSSRRSDDYLQILTDARIDDRIELDELDEMENHHAGLTSGSLEAHQSDMIDEIKKSVFDESARQNVADFSSKYKLTDDEIISSSVFLLVVGLETSATLLTNCTYALAFHPDIQQNLYEAIKSIVKLDRENVEHSFDYDELSSCEYLDAVISETLRSLPPVIELDRMVSQDYHIEKYNVDVKKGDMIVFNLYSIMNNPENWFDPLKFDAGRFIGENKKKIVPGSYCPFGMGPRHCLGMRFSLMETKLALAKVLMKFEFVPAPGTTFPPQTGRIFVINELKHPVAGLKPR